MKKPRFARQIGTADEIQKKARKQKCAKAVESFLLVVRRNLLKPQVRRETKNSFVLSVTIAMVT